MKTIFKIILWLIALVLGACNATVPVDVGGVNVSNTPSPTPVTEPTPTIERLTHSIERHDKVMFTIRGIEDRRYHKSGNWVLSNTDTDSKARIYNEANDYLLINVAFTDKPEFLAVPHGSGFTYTGDVIPGRGNTIGQLTIENVSFTYGTADMNIDLGFESIFGQIALDPSTGVFLSQNMDLCCRTPESHGNPVTKATVAGQFANTQVIGVYHANTPNPHTFGAFIGKKQ